jgi:hypothetical protein
VEVFEDIMARLGLESRLAVNSRRASNMPFNDYEICCTASSAAYKGVQPNTENNDCLAAVKRGGTCASPNDEKSSLGRWDDVDKVQFAQQTTFDGEHVRETGYSADRSLRVDSDSAYEDAPAVQMVDEATAAYSSIRRFMGVDDENKLCSWKVDVVESFCAGAPSTAMKTNNDTGIPHGTLITDRIRRGFTGVSKTNVLSPLLWRR